MGLTENLRNQLTLDPELLAASSSHISALSNRSCKLSASENLKMKKGLLIDRALALDLQDDSQERNPECRVQFNFNCPRGNDLLFPWAALPGLMEATEGSIPQEAAAVCRAVWAQLVLICQGQDVLDPALGCAGT